MSNRIGANDPVLYASAEEILREMQADSSKSAEFNHLSLEERLYLAEFGRSLESARYVISTDKLHVPITVLGSSPSGVRATFADWVQETGSSSDPRPKMYENGRERLLEWLGKRLVESESRSTLTASGHTGVPLGFRVSRRDRWQKGYHVDYIRQTFHVPLLVLDLKGLEEEEAQGELAGGSFPRQILPEHYRQVSFSTIQEDWVVACVDLPHDQYGNCGLENRGSVGLHEFTPLLDWRSNFYEGGQTPFDFNLAEARINYRNKSFQSMIRAALSISGRRVAAGAPSLSERDFIRYALKVRPDLFSSYGDSSCRGRYVERFEVLLVRTAMLPAAGASPDNLASVVKEIFWHFLTSSENTLQKPQETESC